MLKGKQRSYLKKLANPLKSIIQIGKDGVNEGFINQLDAMLERKEIVKVTILENSGLDAKDTANEVCEKLGAEFVQSIGSKFTLYRMASDKEYRTIRLPK